MNVSIKHFIGLLDITQNVNYNKHLVIIYYIHHLKMYQIYIQNLEIEHVLSNQIDDIKILASKLKNENKNQSYLISIIVMLSNVCY